MGKESKKYKRGGDSFNDDERDSRTYKKHKSSKVIHIYLIKSCCLIYSNRFSAEYLLELFVLVILFADGSSPEFKFNYSLTLCLKLLRAVSLPLLTPISSFDPH